MYIAEGTKVIDVLNNLCIFLGRVFDIKIIACIMELVIKHFEKVCGSW